MTERAKYGSLAHLTASGRASHWRKNNPEKVKEYNRERYLYYKEHPRFTGVCKVCGKEFAASRKNAKVCPNCLNKENWRLKNTLQHE